jgi:hypothetical protein
LIEQFDSAQDRFAWRIVADRTADAFAILSRLSPLAAASRQSGGVKCAPIPLELSPGAKLARP